MTTGADIVIPSVCPKGHTRGDTGCTVHQMITGAQEMHKMTRGVSDGSKMGPFLDLEVVYLPRMGPKWVHL